MDINSPAAARHIISSKSHKTTKSICPLKIFVIRNIVYYICIYENKKKKSVQQPTTDNRLPFWIIEIQKWFGPKSLKRDRDE